MSERVVWTEQDKIAIADLSFKIRQNPSSLCTDIECVRRAMSNLLPKEKHRNLTKMIQVGFVTVYWSKKIKEEHHIAVAPVTAKVQSIPKPSDIKKATTYEDFSKRLHTVAAADGFKSVVQWCKEKAEVGESTAYNFRTSKRVPGRSVLARIAEASKKSIDWWLGLEHDSNEEEETPAALYVKAVEEAEKTWPQAINPLLNPADEITPKKITIEDLTTEMLAQELVSRLLKAVDTSTLRSLIREEVNAVLERRLPGILPPDEYVEPEALPVVSPQKKLIKVCVIGLMSKQEHLLKTEYKGEVDFHFMQGSEGQQRMKNTASMMDLTIRTKWVKGAVGSMNGVSNFVHANGLDSIRNLIHGRFKIKSAK